MTTLKATCTLVLLAAVLAGSVNLQAAENLRLNPRLDYSSDSQDGPLITGDRIEEGTVGGRPNYVFVFGEGCFNSKRQARRTISLYEKYRGRVHFVIIDLDRHQSAAQRELVGKYYRGYIPHVVVIDPKGNAVYNRAGEIGQAEITHILDDLIEGPVK